MSVSTSGRCANCDAPIESGALRCSLCGEPATLVCTECGHQNRSKARFCGQCGSPLSGSVSAEGGPPADESFEPASSSMPGQAAPGRSVLITAGCTGACLLAGAVLVLGN